MDRTLLRYSFAAALVLACGTSLGQTHASDIILTADASGVLTTNAEENESVVPRRVFEGEFGESGVPDFTDEPGFDSLIGALPPGTLIGFDIRAALRVWRDGDFEDIADERVRIRKGGVDRFTPPQDETVAGYIFGDVSAAGVFHHHLGFTLVDGAESGVAGVWLLELGLWPESGPLLPSEPFWLVLAQGVEEEEHEAAVDWVVEHLIDDGCTADFNADGVADFFDVQAFLAAFAAGETEADINGDGLFDFFDLQVFLNAFAAGC